MQSVSIVLSIACVGCKTSSLRRDCGTDNVILQCGFKKHSNTTDFCLNHLRVLVRQETGCNLRFNKQNVSFYDSGKVLSTGMQINRRFHSIFVNNFK